MKTAYCLDCDRSIKLGDRVSSGDTVECLYCETAFQIVDLDSLELEWLYAEDNDWAAEAAEEAAEEEEEEEEDLWSWKLAKRSRINAFDRIHDRRAWSAHRHDEHDDEY